MKEKMDAQIAEIKAIKDTLKSVIRNLTPAAMRNPFVFTGDHITFLIKEWVDGNEKPQRSVAYHMITSRQNSFRLI
jgi:hypothetical protein